MVKDELYECIECNGTFDVQHIEAKYEFDLCVFCEAECYNFHFKDDSMMILIMYLQQSQNLKITKPIHLEMKMKLLKRCKSFA